MFHAMPMRIEKELWALLHEVKADLDLGKDARRFAPRREEARQPGRSQQGYMKTIAAAIILPPALWLHSSVAAQDDPMACLDLEIERAYDLNNDGEHLPAAIVAVTNGCASSVDTAVVECAWTESGDVVAAHSTTLSNIGPGQKAILLASSERSGIPRGTKPNCRISLAQ
jgi:hypothetical protein